MPNINNYLKTFAIGTLALYMGQQVFAAKATAPISNAVVDRVFKGLPSIQQPCSKLMPAVFYNSKDIQLIDLSLKKCGFNNFDGLLSKDNLELSPMHLAAIGENYYTLRRLKKLGARIDIQDRRGFTPLHHVAMLGNTVGVKKLLALGADPTLRNIHGATYADLLRWNAPFRNSTGETLDSTLFSAHTKDDYTVDPICLEDGITFVHEMVISPKNQVALWNQKSKGKTNTFTELAEDLLAEYESFKKHPPKLAIVPIEKDDSGKKLGLGNHFCGLVAREHIKRGQVVAEYAGEFINKEEGALREDGSYTMDTFDAKKIDAKLYRSPGAMANHAFPNTYSTSIEFNYRTTDNGQNELFYGVDGLPSRCLLRALSDIEVGEEVTLSYGPFYLSTFLEKDFVELKPVALKKLFSTHPWEALHTSLLGLDSSIDPETRKDHRHIVHQFIYILATPQAIKKVVNLGLLNIEDLKTIQRIDEETGFLKMHKVEYAILFIENALFKIKGEL